MEQPQLAQEAMGGAYFTPLKPEAVSQTDLGVGLLAIRCILFSPALLISKVTQQGQEPSEPRLSTEGSGFVSHAVLPCLETDLLTCWAANVQLVAN
jgi:hypothetical protein